MKTTITQPSRRSVLEGAAASGLAIAAGAVFAPAVHAAPTIKLGYCSPRTGALAVFGEPDDYMLGRFTEWVKPGLKIGGKTYAVELNAKDTQSNPNRAAAVAKELIVQDQIAMMLVASTPETTNPVAAQCESLGVPCISTAAVWQPWFVARQANPADPASWKPFEYTYHFFSGLEDIIAVYTNMWGQLSTNKSVGGLFPDDGDGKAWSDKVTGFPPVLDELGYKLTVPGRFPDNSDDFSAQIDAFRQNDVEIVTGTVLPPDFNAFWSQTHQKGFKPKAATIGRAILFPLAVEALGKSGSNLSSGVWWSPSHPFKSSLGGISAGDLAKVYGGVSGKTWTQQIGFTHTLFEVAVDSLRRSDDIGDAKANVEAIGKTSLDTIVGKIEFGSPKLPPFARKNVAKTPLVGGQWRLTDAGKYELVIVDNQTAPEIPTAGAMQAIV
jgi:branched-chain amino acid transport system substrate-binding protein